MKDPEGGGGQNSVNSLRYAPPPPPPPPPPIFRQKESGTKIICSYLKQQGPLINVMIWDKS